MLASRLRAEDGECDGRRVVPQLRLMTGGSDAGGHDGEVFSVAYAAEGGVAGCRFTPDGVHLFSWSHDRTARGWDLARGQARATLGGHTDRLTAGAVAAARVADWPGGAVR